MALPEQDKDSIMTQKPSRRVLLASQDIICSPQMLPNLDRLSFYLTEAVWRPAASTPTPLHCHAKLNWSPGDL